MSQLRKEVEPRLKKRNRNMKNLKKQIISGKFWWWEEAKQITIYGTHAIEFFKNYTNNKFNLNLEENIYSIIHNLIIQLNRFFWKLTSSSKTKVIMIELIHLTNSFYLYSKSSKKSMKDINTVWLLLPKD